MLEATKRALQLSVTNYDAELSEYIDAGLRDLYVTAGVTAAEDATSDALIKRATVTYACAMFYLTRDVAQYQALMASYDSQKGNLRIATGYTSWGDGT